MAKPECEFYYPSSGAAGHGSAQTRIGQIATSSGPSLQGGLFLEQRESGYSLFLKLPRVAAGSCGAGELKIWAGLGERTYTTLQMQQARMVPVLIQLPLVKVSASGALLHAAEAIKMSVSLFRNTGNYFVVSESGGRLLPPLEPLEWGERYRLLTQESLASALADFGVEVKPEEERRGWIIYELRLPTLAQAGDDSSWGVISRYLGRSIKAPRARVYFVDPPAHHVEPDGAHIFPETTERIVLRRSAGSRVSFGVSGSAVSAARVRDLDDVWCEVTGMSTGEFIVLLDGREELLGRIEECGLFRPEGVRVVVGEKAWEIFQPEVLEAIQHRSQKEVRIECPSMLVAKHLALEKRAWTRDGKTFALVKSEREPAVEAGNFGALAWREASAPTFQPCTVSAQMLPKRVWIEGLAARFAGPGAVLWLRNNWNAATTWDPLGMDLVEMAWLRPHVRLVRSG